MDFWFSIKKFFSACLNPIGFPIFLLAIGLLLVFLASRAPRRTLSPRLSRLRELSGDCGLFLSFLGMIVLFLSSIYPVASGLMRSLEQAYRPLEERDGRPQVSVNPEFVVVLAGGQRNSPGRPVLSRLALVPLARVVGGVDLWKNFPDSMLVFTGNPAETDAMRAVAVRLGVPSDRIIEETKSRCTADHPVKLKAIIGDAPFLLVTSAVHMPRSASLFRRLGFNFTAAPVDFAIWTASEKDQSDASFDSSPKPSNLVLTNAALHEYGGLLWSWLHGELDTSSR